MIHKRQDDAAAPEISAGNTAWVLASTALVFIMIPGLGYFYSGMARSKNALSLVFLCTLAMAVTSLQWWLWGYSLSFSETSTSPIIGNLRHVILRHVEEKPHPNAPTIPQNVYLVYQGMFAAITPALAVGAAAERLRMLPTLLYFFIWSTLVYDFIAYWTWGPNGWLVKLGSLDYAGGTPVHMCSGFAALAYSLVLGKRHGFGEERFAPHNYLNIMLGTALLWFGWFGFNAGSAVAADGRAGSAAIVTHIAASTSGITWMLVAYLRNGHKLSSFHFCSGAVAGLVAITPASGFVSSWAAVVFGVVAGIVCHFSVDLKERLRFDDALDVFAIHGIGGLIGNLLTGIFADKDIAMLSGTEIPGGWVNKHWVQLPIQMAACGAGAGWAFVVSFVILYAMNKIPFLRMRVDIESEMTGLDLAEMGEPGYDYMVSQKERALESALASQLSPETATPNEGSSVTPTGLIMNINKQ